MDKLLFLFAQYKISVAPLPHANSGQSEVQAILTIVYTVTGAITLLMFTLGGFRYITAQGDPNGVSKAKQTLIYAIVGLLITITAVSIVGFVGNKI